MAIGARSDVGERHELSIFSSHTWQLEPPGNAIHRLYDVGIIIQNRDRARLSSQ